MNYNEAVTSLFIKEKSPPELSIQLVFELITMGEFPLHKKITMEKKEQETFMYLHFTTTILCNSLIAYGKNGGAN